MRAADASSKSPCVVPGFSRAGERNRARRLLRRSPHNEVSPMRGANHVKNHLTFAGLMTVILGLAVSYPTAQAGPSGPRQVRADLNGYQEVSSISTTGVGRFTASIEDDNRIITYVLTYAGLEGATTTAAHIHFAQRSVNGGVNAFLCGGGDKPPCPATEGTVEGEIDAADVLGAVPDRGIEPGAFEEFVQAIRAGHTYVNVHTDKWPGGEIRGQIHDRDQKEFVR